MGLTIPAGTGHVVTRDVVTANLSTFQVGENGTFIIKTAFTRLLNDPNGNNMGSVLDGAPEVGLGRVLLVGDVDMFNNTYQGQYPENVTLSNNVVSWALDTARAVTGNVALGNIAGSPNQLPMHLDFLSGGTNVASADVLLDADANFWTVVPVTGTVDVRIKPQDWLSVLATGVNMHGGSVTLNVAALYCGDANGSNRITMMDLAWILADFGAIGDLPADVNRSGRVTMTDLAIVLLNFGLSGE